MASGLEPRTGWGEQQEPKGAVKGQQRPPSAGGCISPLASSPAEKEKHLQFPASGVSPGQVGKVRSHVRVSRCMGAQGLEMSLEKETPPLWGSRCILCGEGQGKDGVQVPGSLCEWIMVNSELAGRCVPGTPAPWEHLGEAAQHQPKLRDARGTEQGQTALAELSVLAAQEGSAAGGHLRGLRLRLVSSCLSTMEQLS